MLISYRWWRWIDVYVMMIMKYDENQIDDDQDCDVDDL